MAVKDFRDLVGDIVSDFAKNSSQDVYVFTQTGDKKGKYHPCDAKCFILEDKKEKEEMSNARIIPLKLAKFMGYTNQCSFCKTDE